jgi:hypothetical protein
MMVSTFAGMIFVVAASRVVEPPKTGPVSEGRIASLEKRVKELEARLRLCGESMKECERSREDGSKGSGPGRSTCMIGGVRRPVARVHVCGGGDVVVTMLHEVDKSRAGTTITFPLESLPIRMGAVLDYQDRKDCTFDVLLSYGGETTWDEAMRAEAVVSRYFRWDRIRRGGKQGLAEQCPRR